MSVSRFELQLRGVACIVTQTAVTTCLPELHDLCVSTATVAPTPERVDKRTKLQLTNCPFHLRQHICFRMLPWRGMSHSWKPFALKSNSIFKSNLLKVKWNGSTAKWNSMTPVVLNPIAHQPGGRMFTVSFFYYPQHRANYWKHIAHIDVHIHTRPHWHTGTCTGKPSPMKSLQQQPPLAVWLHTPHWGGPTSWNSFQQIFKVVIGCSHSWVSLSPNAACSLSLHLSPILFLLLFLENKNVRSNVLRSAVSLSYWSEWAKRNISQQTELSFPAVTDRGTPGRRTWMNSSSWRNNWSLVDWWYQCGSVCFPLCFLSWYCIDCQSSLPATWTNDYYKTHIMLYERAVAKLSLHICSTASFEI